MSAHIEWVNANYIDVRVIGEGTVLADSLTTDPGNLGLAITGENGDGVVVEGSYGQLMDLGVQIKRALLSYAMDELEAGRSAP